MKTSILATLSAAVLPLSAQLQTDAHWSYEPPEFSPEPFAFQVSGNYLYAGGLFLRTDGVSDGKNFVRFDLTTQTWEQAPGFPNEPRRNRFAL